MNRIEEKYKKLRAASTMLFVKHPFLRNKKGTVQRDGSGQKWSHLIDLYKMERRGGFQRNLPVPNLLELFKVLECLFF